MLPDGSFEIDRFLQLLTRLGVALGLALPIGFDREVSSRSAGLRTFPLVALAACGFIVIGLQVVGPTGEAQARVLEGLMTGIGFVGGGAILKDRQAVRGTATAASIWATGAMGAAAGYGRYETAVLLCVLTLAVLRILGILEVRVVRGLRDRSPDES
jgi:putative Mg2+ transporter-C (MgtC) family protein